MKRLFCFALALVGVLTGFSSCSKTDGSGSVSESSLVGDYVCQKIVLVADGTTTTYPGEDVGKGVLESLPFYYEIDLMKGGKCSITEYKGSIPESDSYSVKDNYFYLAYSGMDLPIFKIKSKSGKTLVVEPTEAWMELIQLGFLLNYDSELESAVATYQKR